MPRREEDFSGRCLMETTRRSPVHRQMAADGKFAPAPVAARQHGVRRLLRDDALRQFPRAAQIISPTRHVQPVHSAAPSRAHCTWRAMPCPRTSASMPPPCDHTSRSTIQSSAATKKTNAQIPPAIHFMERVPLVVWCVFFMEWLVGAVAYFIVDLFPNQAKVYVFSNLYPCPHPNPPHGGGSRYAADSNNCCRIANG